MVNCVAFGRITRDAEIKVRQSDNREFVVFTLACDADIRKGEDGGVTNFYRCYYHNAAIAQYLVKGRIVEVAGTLKVTESQSQDGSGKSYVNLDISVNNIQLGPDPAKIVSTDSNGFASVPAGSQAKAAKQAGQKGAKAPIQRPDAGPDSFSDDDVPF